MPSVTPELPKGFEPDISSQETPNPPPGFDLDVSEPIQAESNKPGWIAKTASSIARPVLSGTLGAAGAIAGTGATPGIGTLAGGGLGFAAGEELADLLDEFLGLRERQPILVELAESASDVVEGAAYEAGGHAAAVGAGHAIKFIAKKIPKMPSISKSGATKEAGDIIAANTTGGPIIAKNLEEAQALEDAIPGLKFGRGQLTNDPNIIKFERAHARMPGEVAAQQAEQTAANSKALRVFIEKTKGPATIGDTIKPIAAHQKVAGGRIGEAEHQLEREAIALKPTFGAVETGLGIRESAREGKSAVRKKASELFEDVPEFGVDASTLISEIDELSRPLSKFEDAGKNIPYEFAKYKDVLEETKGIVTPKDLQGLRSSLTDTLRDAQSAASPNNRMISRISGLIGGVDDVLKTTGESAPKLKKAQQFFKEEVVGKYQTGAVGDILKRGASGAKVSNANIASKFFKSGRMGEESAQQFLDAVGDNKNAKEAILNHIRQDLLNFATNPMTGQMSTMKYKAWVARNAPALKKFELLNKFDSVLKATTELDSAIDMKKAFDKSAASKLLNSDVDKAVQNAFSSGSKKSSALSLMRNLRGDKKAIQGLQNGVIDHIINKAETTAVDAFQNPVVSMAGLEREFKKFKPVIDVIFKNSPEKIKALNQYRKAMRILQRGKTSPIGGGSDTAENIIHAMSKASGLSVSKIVNIGKAIMRPLLEMSDNQVNALLNRAAFDPDFAYTLHMMATRGKSVDAIALRLRGHMISAGLKTIK